MGPQDSLPCSQEPPPVRVLKQVTPLRALPCGHVAVWPCGRVAVPRPSKRLTVCVYFVSCCYHGSYVTRSLMDLVFCEVPNHAVLRLFRVSVVCQLLMLNLKKRRSAMNKGAESTLGRPAYQRCAWAGPAPLACGAGCRSGAADTTCADRGLGVTSCECERVNT